jgi:hypothetical protein
VRQSLLSSSGNLAKAQPAQTPQEHYLPLQTNSLQAKLATLGEHIMFAKTFRNTLVASSLLIGASLLAGPAALAAPSIAGDTVTATVAEVNVATFVGATTAFTNGAAVPAFVMGTLNVQNNAAAGWTLGVASTNGGTLNGATFNITYTDLTTGTIGGSSATAVDPSTGGTLHDSAFDTVVAEGVTGVAVTANIGSGQFVPVGSYTDTLTFTLTSKL